MKQIHPFDLYEMLSKSPVAHIVKRDGRTINNHAELGPTFGPNIYPDRPITRGTIIEIDGEQTEITAHIPPITANFI